MGIDCLGQLARILWSLVMVCESVIRSCDGCRWPFCTWWRSFVPTSGWWSSNHPHLLCSRIQALERLQLSGRWLNIWHTLDCGGMTSWNVPTCNPIWIHPRNVNAVQRKKQSEDWSTMRGFAQSMSFRSVQQEGRSSFACYEAEVKGTGLQGHAVVGRFIHCQASKLCQATLSLGRYATRIKQIWRHVSTVQPHVAGVPCRPSLDQVNMLCRKPRTSGLLFHLSRYWKK